MNQFYQDRRHCVHYLSIANKVNTLDRKHIYYTPEHRHYQEALTAYKKYMCHAKAQNVSQRMYHESLSFALDAAMMLFPFMLPHLITAMKGSTSFAPPAARFAAPELRPLHRMQCTMVSSELCTPAKG